jgi:hypothetical protein
MKRLIGIAIAVIAATRLVAAQPADVPGQIKFVETQPADMDRSAWKEKRRDAVRRLGQSKDKRAVPVLIKLAETETFDIIGEIAIEGLGNLGDQSAVPVLQKIANDAAREKPQRELAKKALGKLGASTTAPKNPPTGTPPTGTPPTGTPPTGTPPTGTPPTGTPTSTPPTGTGEVGSGEVSTPPETNNGALGTGKLGGDKGSTLIDKPAAGLPALPNLPADLLAGSERLTFVLGSALFNYDTVRERLSFDADVSGVYARRIEREKMAWGFDVGAHVIAGLINPDGRAQSRGSLIQVTGNGEARFYNGKVYGIGKAALGTQITYISFKDDMDATQDNNDTRFSADLQIALGAGFGRVVDVGAAIRVRRLARALDAAKALGKPIGEETSKKLQLTWWALRGERSQYRALTSTVAILREAGILLVEPDAGLSFEILNVLRDTQLFQRPSGFDAQILFSEGYLKRPDDTDMDDRPLSGEEGRIEQLLLAAGYGTQLADDTVEISGTGYARYRLFAPGEGSGNDQPTPFFAGATARLRKFTYGEHGDQFGALDLLGDLRVSSDGDNVFDANDERDLGLRLSAQLGFTYFVNQASGVRVAGTFAADGGEFFLGASLSLTYGLLDSGYAQGGL